MTHYEGGYVLTPKADLFLSKGEPHTQTLDNPVSPSHLDALNRVQATPFRINRFILEIAREAMNNEVWSLVPRMSDYAYPPHIDDDVWDRMTDDQRAKVRQDRAIIHTKNAQRHGKADSFIRRLTIADRMDKYEEHWYPHAFDFRYRMYPIPTDLSPQQDDLSHGLLMFSRGKRLGDHGVYWLAIHLACCAGQDKLPFSDRLRWTLDNHERIIRTAKDPLMDLWWVDHDEPWSFLAAANEWKMAHEDGDPADFISHLPIPQDGSINGCQHLSLLGRDPIGALATNCTSSPDRQDLYIAIQKAVMESVSKDAAEGVAEAQEWVGNIHRKTVKRAVMTTPYGVTQRGIATQLINDGMIPEEAVDVNKSAAYMCQKIVDAMRSVITSGKLIMDYLQQMAKVCAENDLPLEWTIPTGSRVRQQYTEAIGIRAQTLIGRLTILDKMSGKISASKSKSAAAPNVIHSLDAAMLATCVNDLWAKGIRDFQMIHDSYAVHACDVPTMRESIRSVAYNQYKGDWLAEFHAEQLARLPPDVEAPTPPERGTFDVAEVLNAPYFFS